MIIRQEQMAVFQSAEDAKYHLRLMDYYRKTIPEQAAKYDDKSLMRLIAETHQRARKRGVKTPEGLCRFIGLALIVNPHFDDEPKTAAFFAARELDPDVKVKMLCNAISARLSQASAGMS